MAPGNNSSNSSNSGNLSPDSPARPVKAVPKTSAQGFGTNMPMMSSAFDTAMWLNAA